MGQDPDAIRQDIEQTREQMGETIGAIGYKTDVKERAKDSVSEKTDAIKSKVSGVMGKANDATPSGGEVKQGAQQAVSVAQENPLGLAIGAVAAGFIAGMLIPSTRVEDEKMGEMSDQVMDTVKESGQEAVDRGKQVAQEVAGTARETAREQTAEQGSQMAESLKESARQAAPTGSSGSAS
jgi:gas vesicle protein